MTLESHFFLDNYQLHVRMQSAEVIEFRYQLRSIENASQKTVVTIFKTIA